MIEEKGYDAALQYSKAVGARYGGASKPEDSESGAGLGSDSGATVLGSGGGAD
jgi:hypothetical protein